MWQLLNRSQAIIIIIVRSKCYVIFASNSVNFYLIFVLCALQNFDYVYEMNSIFMCVAVDYYYYSLPVFRSSSSSKNETVINIAIVNTLMHVFSCFFFANLCFTSIFSFRWVVFFLSWFLFFFSLLLLYVFICDTTKQTLAVNIAIEIVQ